MGAGTILRNALTMSNQEYERGRTYSTDDGRVWKVVSDEGTAACIYEPPNLRSRLRLHQPMPEPKLNKLTLAVLTALSWR